MDCKYQIEDIGEAARMLIEDMGEDRIFAFDGPMGAGKTTLISEVCRRLGVKDDVGSPTFSIVNEYRDGEGNPIYHFDFYRIKDLEEAIEIGIDDYFYSGALCLIEWPERIDPLLPDETRTVSLRVLDPTTREMHTR